MFDYNSEAVAQQIADDYAQIAYIEVREAFLERLLGAQGTVGCPTGPTGPTGCFYYTQRKEAGAIGDPLRIAANWNEQTQVFDCWVAENVTGEEAFFALPRSVFARMFHFADDQGAGMDIEATDDWQKVSDGWVKMGKVVREQRERGEHE